MLKVAFDPRYVLDLPPGHRFPMEKYDLLPRQLIHEGTLSDDNFFEPGNLNDEDALAAHNDVYLDKLYGLRLNRQEERATGFRQTESLVEREKLIMEGTRACAELALLNGAAMNIAGGTHHAFSDKGEGFCLMNDQAIAARWLLREKKAGKILVIDLDVHQGNGTAEIFQNDLRVFTFSMHGRNNYPLKKELSDLDVELDDGIRDKDYLYQLESSLDRITEQLEPDFIFYQCGVDVLDSDQLGRLNISMNGCKRRDEVVFEFVNSLKVPVVCSMGGGYSKDIKVIIEAHANTFRSAQQILF